LSRLLLPARDLCDGKALPPIQKFLARMIDVRRVHFGGPASPAKQAGKSRSIDVDGPAEDLVRVLPGDPTG
jgi:hypothetical protein